jgi:hypothetical protein
VFGEMALLVLLALGIMFVLRARRQLTELAAQIRELRAHATSPVSYRATGGDGLDAELDSTVREAEAAGFTMLGDYLEESPVRDGGMPMRWFVDARGTTFGWMAPFEVKGERQIVLVLMSHELSTQTITARAPRASALSRPPFVHARHVELSASLADTVAAHRAAANLDDDSRGFVPVKTFEQLRHELERMRAKVIAWREAQPRDELLDADLRMLLGGQYERLARAMRRRLAS